MKAWVYQDSKMKKKHGEAGASWYVGWRDPDGRDKCKSCGPGRDGRDKAKSLARKIDRELATGTYGDVSKTKWETFINEYQKKVLDGMKGSSASSRKTALKHFLRLAKPIYVRSIDTRMIDAYIAARRKERDGISNATINRELRELRAVVRKACRWGYLPNCPDFCFVKEKQKLITFVSPEYFGKLYAAAEHVAEPEGTPFPAADWWRGLLVTAYLTGWRIGSLLSLKWRSVDLAAGTALSLAEFNKGGRDLLVALDPVVITHLRKIESFGPAKVFPCRDRRALYGAWHALQDAAGIKREDGRYFGFHDLRRAFATENHTRLTPQILQKLMQHKDGKTTDRYIKMGAEVRPTAHQIFVPPCLVQANTANAG